LIASGTAIAGSSIIGNNVSIGGQVGIVGHLKIGDNCMIGAKSLVTKSFSKNLFISGNPAMLHKKRIKQDVALRKLTNKNS
jgi:UDP-3-O-[3-hydroxymyristoyl] glucosamine N-acyltransferase